MDLAAPPLTSDLDLYLIGEGKHRRLWEVLGAHVYADGVRFAVWAPNARKVSVVGEFCTWNPSEHPLEAQGDSGVWAGFVPGLEAGALYKFAIETQAGELLEKADPMARRAELPPCTASVVEASSYAWGDATWLEQRAKIDPRRAPMSTYEVHLGSWAHGEGGRPLTYRELAPRLIEHAQRFGFTHLELLPVMEHPFGGSWGYQVTGYFAPTARHGSPDDLRFLIDQCHQAGVGVILDWVPAHFPRDAFALAAFDGTCLYEHAGRRGEHPDWGTLIFNTGRHEVRGFLIASALYWLQAFHADGLRVDAVASMLYLDYSREDGDWTPNAHGGREDLENVAFLRELNAAVAAECPGCFTVAEESTSWSGVTAPVEDGGLGFTFKWNMGWMHDTLTYLGRDPVHRAHHHDQLTFAQVYEQTERFVMPLSHDEVVHGKGSLLSRMPGDRWQQLANLRLLFAYQIARPGKSLLFQGAELAMPGEWDHEQPLPLEHGDPGVASLLADLGALYRASPCLWRSDPDPDGFAWIDCNDRENSVLAFERRDGDAHLVVVLNLTPVPRSGYRIGAPAAGTYWVALDTDATGYGGSGWLEREAFTTETVEHHGREHSLALDLPPLAALILEPDGDHKSES